MLSDNNEWFMGISIILAPIALGLYPTLSGFLLILQIPVVDSKRWFMRIFLISIGIVCALAFTISAISLLTLCQLIIVFDYKHTTSNNLDSYKIYKHENHINFPLIPRLFFTAIIYLALCVFNYLINGALVFVNTYLYSGI